MNDTMLGSPTTRRRDVKTYAAGTEGQQVEEIDGRNRLILRYIPILGNQMNNQSNIKTIRLGSEERVGRELGRMSVSTDARCREHVLLWCRPGLLVVISDVKVEVFFDVCLAWVVEQWERNYLENAISSASSGSL